METRKMCERCHRQPTRVMMNDGMAVCKVCWEASTIPASVLPTCAECGLPVVFIGHHGDIATHAAPNLDPDRTAEAAAANRMHDPQPTWP